MFRMRAQRFRGGAEDGAAAAFFEAQSAGAGPYVQLRAGSTQPFRCLAATESCLTSGTAEQIPGIDSATAIDVRLVPCPTAAFTAHWKEYFNGVVEWKELPVTQGDVAI